MLAPSSTMNASAKTRIGAQLAAIFDALNAACFVDRSAAFQMHAFYAQTVGELQGIAPTTAATCFAPLLSDKRTFECLLHQKEQPGSAGVGDDEAAAAGVLLRDAVMQRAADTSQLIFRRRPEAFTCLFSDNPSAAFTWFGGFSMDGMTHFSRGARALASYALLHRDQARRRSS